MSRPLGDFGGTGTHGAPSPRMQAFEGGSIPRLAASDPSALPRWSSLRRTADRGFEARLAPERRAEAPPHRERVTATESHPGPTPRPREEPPAREVDPRDPRIAQRPEPEPNLPDDSDPRTDDAAVLAAASPASDPSPRSDGAPGPVEGETSPSAASTPLTGPSTPASIQSVPAPLAPAQGPPGATSGGSPTVRSTIPTTPIPSSNAATPATARRAESPRPPLPQSTSPALLAQAEAARDRIVQQVVLQTAPDGGRVKLSLTPPELGRLDVELVVEDGRHARLVLLADRPETAQVLERALPDLARSLADQGLVLDESRVGTRDPSTDRSAPDGRDGWSTTSDDFAEPIAGLWRTTSSTLRGDGLDWIA